MHKIRTHLLTPLPAQQYNDKPFWVFDIETGKPGDQDTLGGRLVAAQFRCSADPDQAYWYYSEDDVIEHLLKKCKGQTVWAHNGAGYDYLYLVRWLQLHKEDYPGVTLDFLPRSDGRVIALKIRRGKHVTTCLDSFHVFPKSLKDFTLTFAPEYQKHDRVWKNENGQIRWFDPDDPIDCEYLDYDCLGLVHALQRFKKLMFEQFGVNITLTAAGTAMKAWRRSLPEDAHYWRTRPEVEQFVRTSYAGGYVFLTTTDMLIDRVHVDINAAYAASMRLGVPCGVAAYTDRYMPGYPGFYRVIAHVPTTERYPIVPCLDKGITTWKTGDFETIIPSCTLEYAQALGCRFDVIEGYVFDSIDYPFQTFLDRCENLEIAHTIDGEKDSVAECAKLLRNSLYGRFGMRPVGKKIYFTQEADELAQPLINGQTGEIIEDFYEETTSLSMPYMQIQWASWITAQTRIAVHKMAYAGRASYGDTDSANMSREDFETLVERGIITIGNRYGQVKVEKEFAWFVAMGPKNYIGMTKEGKEVNKAKGMPRGKIITSEHMASSWRKILKQWYGMKSLQTLLKDPTTMVQQRKRSYSDLAHSASWHEDPATHEVYPKTAVLTS